VDSRCDIYALGSMLYCFLTGATPFKGETYVDLLLEKEKGKFTPARRSNSNIPERLDLMLDKAMAAKPDLRYKSCAEFAKDLQGLNLANEALSFIEGAVRSSIVKSGAPTQPVPAKPPSPKPGAPAAAAGKPGAPAPAAGKPGAPAAGKTAAGDVWYIVVPTDKGKSIKRKMTTPKVLELIQRKDFDLGSLASRSLKGPYRNLNYYKEFAPALENRLTQAKANRKAAKFHNAYEKIMAEEKTFAAKRKLKNMFRSVGGLISFGIFLIVVLGMIGGVGYYVYTLFNK